MIISNPRILGGGSSGGQLKLRLRLTPPLLLQLRQLSSSTRQSPVTRLSTERIAVHLLQKWATSCTDGPSVVQFSEEVIHCVTQFFQHYGSRLVTRKWTYPWLYYVSRFLRRNTGEPLSSSELARLCKVSAVITVKFWNDFETANRDAGRLLGLPMKALSETERLLLEVLDYNLMIPPKTLVSFKNWSRTQYLHDRR